MKAAGNRETLPLMTLMTLICTDRLKGQVKVIHGGWSEGLQATVEDSNAEFISSQGFLIGPAGRFGM
jgi:hypothetical protein